MLSHPLFPSTSGGSNDAVAARAASRLSRCEALRAEAEEGVRTERERRWDS
jgi:hypothetical protein